MKRYVYHGDTPCRFSYNSNKGPVEVCLFFNETYTLPSSNDFVKSLIAQGLLIELRIKKK